MIAQWRAILIVIFLALSTAEVLEFRAEFEAVLKRIHTERPYSTVLLLTREAEDCVDNDLPLYIMETPVINLDTEQTIQIKEKFNSEILAIMCMSSLNDSQMIQKLSTNLNHMRDSRVLIIVNAKLEMKYDDDDMHNMFEQCQNLKFLNVNILYRDFFETGVFHSFTQFPEFRLETYYLKPVKPIFPDRLKNMHGKKLITLPDLTEPRSMLYTDAKGDQKMLGYIGKLMNTFASHYNFTLKFPYKISSTEAIYASVARDYTRNGTIDVGTSLSAPQREMNIHEYTYPVEMFNWRLMLPIEHTVPIYQLLLRPFSHIELMVIALQGVVLALLLSLYKIITKQNNVSVNRFLLDVLTNDVTLRGTLGQAFKMEKNARGLEKFIYLLVFLAGIVISTKYTSNIIQFLTAPPLQKPVTTLDDLRRHNVKILTTIGDLYNLKRFTSEEFQRKFDNSSFVFVQTIEEYQTLRRSLDTRYAYTLGTAGWMIFEEQQKYFSRKLFRLSPEIVFVEYIHFAIPIHENSIYKVPLNNFIFNIMDSGIYWHWFSMTFYDMVALKRISFADLSTPISFHPLDVSDFYSIWIFYGVAIGICICIYIVEIIIHGKSSVARMPAEYEFDLGSSVEDSYSKSLNATPLRRTNNESENTNTNVDPYNPSENEIIVCSEEAFMESKRSLPVHKSTVQTENTEVHQ